MNAFRVFKGPNCTFAYYLMGLSIHRPPSNALSFVLSIYTEAEYLNKQKQIKIPPPPQKKVHQHPIATRFIPASHPTIPYLPPFPHSLNYLNYNICALGLTLPSLTVV